MELTTNQILIQAKIIAFLEMSTEKSPDLMEIMNNVKSDTISPLQVIEELKNLQCKCKVLRRSNGLRTSYQLTKNLA
jgi:hypothetical protein